MLHVAFRGHRVRINRRDQRGRDQLLQAHDVPVHLVVFRITHNNITIVRPVRKRHSAPVSYTHLDVYKRQRYYNQQGKDCFLGTLRATAKLSL